MRLPRGSNALLAVLLVLLVVGLAVLALLQYRWIDRVTDAERQRMQGSIDFSARHFVADLQGEMEEIFRIFGGPEGGDLADRYMEWTQRAADPELIAAIYLLQPDEELTLQRFDLETMELADTSWPASFAEIRQHLERQRTVGRRMPPPFFPVPPVVFIGPRRGPPQGLFSDEPPEEDTRFGTLVAGSSMER